MLISGFLWVITANLSIKWPFKIAFYNFNELQFYHSFENSKNGSFWDRWFLTDIFSSQVNANSTQEKQELLPTNGNNTNLKKPITYGTCVKTRNPAITMIKHEVI